MNQAHAGIGEICMLSCVHHARYDNCPSVVCFISLMLYGCDVDNFVCNTLCCFPFVAFCNIKIKLIVLFDLLESRKYMVILYYMNTEIIIVYQLYVIEMVQVYI